MCDAGAALRTHRPRALRGRRRQLVRGTNPLRSHKTGGGWESDRDRMQRNCLVVDDIVHLNLQFGSFAVDPRGSPRQQAPHDNPSAQRAPHLVHTLLRDKRSLRVCLL